MSKKNKRRKNKKDQTLRTMTKAPDILLGRTRKSESPKSQDGFPLRLVAAYDIEVVRELFADMRSEISNSRES